MKIYKTTRLDASSISGAYEIPYRTESALSRSRKARDAPYRCCWGAIVIDKGTLGSLSAWGVSRRDQGRCTTCPIRSRRVFTLTDLGVIRSLSEPYQDSLSGHKAYCVPYPSILATALPPNPSVVPRIHATFHHLSPQPKATFHIASRPTSRTVRMRLQ